MRRAGPWLLVVALVALAVAATVDAFRGRAGMESRPEQGRDSTATSRPVSAAAALRERGVSGVLYVSTRRTSGCRIVALPLPDLEPQAAFETDLCRVEAGPRGRVALSSDCPGRVEIRSSTGDLLERPLVGCAPAWRPALGGPLTMVSGGSVVSVDRGCAPPGVGPCFRVLLAANDLGRQLRAAPRLPGVGSYSIRELGWLSPSRLVILVRWQGRFTSDFPVVVEAGTLVPPPGIGPPGSLSHLDVSGTAGEIVASLRPMRSGSRGFDAFDDDGRFVGERRHVFGSNRAYVRSPDERWIATGGPEGVHIFPADESGRLADPVLVPLRRVTDLAWG